MSLVVVALGRYAFLLILLLLNWRLLRTRVPVLAANPLLKRLPMLLFSLVLLGPLAWLVGRILNVWWLITGGVFVQGALLVLLLPMLPTLLVVAGLQRLLGGRNPRPSHSPVLEIKTSASQGLKPPMSAAPPETLLPEFAHQPAASAPFHPPHPASAALDPTLDPSRRRFLFYTSTALPAASAIVSGGGLAMAQLAPRTPTHHFDYPDLPQDLDGLRIVQLTDLHLGMFVTVRDVERVLLRLEALKPDLVVITGDVADDLRQLRDALQLMGGLKTRLGVFACLGNHEYYRGIEAVRRIYDGSPVPLLVNSHQTLKVGTTSLVVGAVDDPVGLLNARGMPVEETVGLSLSGAPSDAFRLLLAHRPGTFNEASRQGYHLTLSGHTHGGQLGLFRRSVFEPLMPDAYLWGPYSRGSARLYTSCGFGHWFPFRLNCPAEAPLIILRRNSSSS